MTDNVVSLSEYGDSLIDWHGEAMEPTFAILLLIACGIVGLCASMRTFLIVTTIVVLLLGFWPVAYQYAQTSDGSLIWEAAFRAALLAIAGFVANAYLKFNAT